MFLIEYSKGKFINAELIDWISMSSGVEIEFKLAGDSDSFYKVKDGFDGTFINSLQALNTNFPIDRAWSDLKNA